MTKYHRMPDAFTVDELITVKRFLSLSTERQRRIRSLLSYGITEPAKSKLSLNPERRGRKRGSGVKMNALIAALREKPRTSTAALSFMLYGTALHTGKVRSLLGALKKQGLVINVTPGEWEVTADHSSHGNESGISPENAPGNTSPNVAELLPLS